MIADHSVEETSDRFTLFNGDCIAEMKKMPDCSVHAIVTDPPYELGFMGKSWDATGIAYNVDVWKECLRVLKPGGHLLSFGGSRTYHRMACAIEDAGFEIRDQIMWVYSSGFPKSLNISKKIDDILGLEREVVGFKRGTTVAPDNTGEGGYRGGVGVKQASANVPVTIPASDEAKVWDGFGTALKPSHEPIVMARKPLEAGLTVAENVLKHGAGGINIDGCRVGNEEMNVTVSTGKVISANRAMGGGNTERADAGTKVGRWPANFAHDGSDEVLELFPSHSDSGSAARFFYCSKTSKKDRNEGLAGREKKKSDTRSEKSAGLWHSMNAPHENHHPTVKPTSLMRYLVRLVTPPSGIVLDPFTGSGSTGKAAILEGFRFVGIEKEKPYYEIAKARIEDATNR
ncbi:MAG: site-specific DNA-methyltransferase [Actinobacteria bacterium]|nr:site-specific DNA-methyltransferase [Actinomycetota bacterium]